MAALRISRFAARLLIGGLAALVVALAIVIWPHALQPGPAPSVSEPPIVPTPVPKLPQGAMWCEPVYPEVTTPFKYGANGTPMTSCAFVEQVRRAYANKTSSSSRPSLLAVVSPATRKWYNLSCFETGDYATCTGGQGAVIYLYNK